MIDKKLLEFRTMLLDEDYSLGIDEVLGYIQYLYEDDKEVEKKIDSYIDDYYKVLSCAYKFYKVKDLVDEEFYMEEDK